MLFCPTCVLSASIEWEFSSEQCPWSNEPVVWCERSNIVDIAGWWPSISSTLWLETSYKIPSVSVIVGIYGTEAIFTILEVSSHCSQSCFWSRPSEGYIAILFNSTEVGDCWQIIYQYCNFCLICVVLYICIVFIYHFSLDGYTFLIEQCHRILYTVYWISSQCFHCLCFCNGLIQFTIHIEIDTVRTSFHILTAYVFYKR